MPPPVRHGVLEAPRWTELGQSGRRPKSTRQLLLAHSPRPRVPLPLPLLGRPQGDHGRGAHLLNPSPSPPPVGSPHFKVSSTPGTRAYRLSYARKATKTEGGQRRFTRTAGRRYPPKPHCIMSVVRMVRHNRALLMSTSQMQIAYADGRGSLPRARPEHATEHGIGSLKGSCSGTPFFIDSSRGRVGYTTRRMAHCQLPKASITSGRPPIHAFLDPVR